MDDKEKKEEADVIEAAGQGNIEPADEIPAHGSVIDKSCDEEVDKES